MSRPNVFRCVIPLLILLFTVGYAFEAQAQLGTLTKTDGGVTVQAGDTIHYKVTIPVVGPDAVEDVVFTDFPDPLTSLVNGSVTTTQGTITRGNGAGDSSIIVEVGDMNPGDVVMIEFDVVVFDGIAYPVMVHNQGSVNGQPTNDEETPVDPQDNPSVDATKSCTLHTDLDGGGAISQGDTVRYVVNIPNTGTIAVQDAVFTDTPDPNTSLVVGSVTTSQGNVISGNGAGDTSIIVSLGIVNPNTSVTITFDVVVDNDVNSISNQGFVDLQGTIVPTDDPSTPAPDDATICQVTPPVTPQIDSLKSVNLLIDADGGGAPSPGDTLQYVIRITNTGSAPQPGVVFSDVPDPQTRLVTGTVTTTPQGVIVEGNGAADNMIEVNVGTVNPGVTVTITFNVTINAGATGTVSNQGITTTPGNPPDPTDDPDTDPPDDPTDTPVTPQETPELGQPTKTVSLNLDADGNGVISTGDNLTYIIKIPNIGNAIINDVDFVDGLDPGTSLIVGSVTTTHGSVTTGNTTGDRTVVVDVGSLLPGETVTIMFDVVITGATGQISNQGTVNTPTGPTPTDNPDTPEPEDPTVTPVSPQGPPVVPTKTVSLDTDADRNGNFSPGDTIKYTIRIPNVSVVAIPAVIFSDNLDPMTTLANGTVTTTTGTVTSGNANGDTLVQVNVGTINSGDIVTITFEATINAGATMISNQAIVDSPITDRIPTDDPTTPTPTDPTITQVPPAPLARCEAEVISRLSSTTLVVRLSDGSSSNNSDIVDWMWDFGDGGTCNQNNLAGCSARVGGEVIEGTVRNPVHIFKGLGRWVVELKVTDNFGNIDVSKCAFTFGDPPITEVLDENINDIIDDEEIIMAIDYWIMGKPIPNTNGKVITDKLIKLLVDYWITGKPISQARSSDLEG